MDHLLSKELIGHLGCYADEQVYITPISYAYDGQYIYAHTYAGMKLQMMRKNPSVCFQVDDMHDLSNWQSVIIWGEFEELSSDEQREFALDMLMNRNLPYITSETMHLSGQWPFSDTGKKMIEGVFFRIRIDRKTGRYEKKEAQYYFAS